ncbi:hypothetical protein BGX30_007228, partial [Mortierella sp. GBA39]
MFFFYSHIAPSSCLPRFKSRTDTQQRHTVRTINISNAPNVDEAELAKMTIPKPRSKNSSTISAKEADSSNNTNPTAATPDNSSSKKQKPEAKPRQKKKKQRKPRKPKSSVMLLKSGFSRSFATSTQTVGSVEGCLRRALLPAGECGRIPRISDNDIKAMANRIGAAVDTMAEARMYVFRTVEIMILDELLRPQGGGRGEPGVQVGTLKVDEETFDVLDLLLEKDAGTAIIKHLFSLVLNGKIDRGPETVKEESKAAKRMALDAFARLRMILPGFQPVNKGAICLGRLNVDAAAEFSMQLRKHFRNLPFTIGGRMLKCGWVQDDIPPDALKDQSISRAAQEDQENGEADKDDDDGDDGDEEDGGDDADPKSRFESGHLRRWWTEAGRLPSQMRPLFCLRHQFKDPFITFEERALPQILWSTTKTRPNPAADAACKIMSAKDASTLVETVHGELTRILFYGDRREIKQSPSVWQTSYGRRTTTMASLATSHPASFDPTVLHTYIDAKFKHINSAIDCKEKGIPCD